MIHDTIHSFKDFLHDHANEVTKGGLGLMSSIAGIGVSTLQEVEMWLRLVSLCAGIMVALVTTWSILRKNWSKEDKK
jgi:hypothetical protein